MGYRKVPVIHTLEFKQYEGLIVRMKSLKIGKMRKIVRLLNDEHSETADVIDEMINSIAEGLVSWNLEDEDGASIPASREQVEELEFDMIQSILSEWLGKVTGPDEELGKDSSSGVKFPGQPLTMEAL